MAENDEHYNSLLYKLRVKSAIMQLELEISKQFTELKRDYAKNEIELEDAKTTINFLISRYYEIVSMYKKGNLRTTQEMWNDVNLIKALNKFKNQLSNEETTSFEDK